jgi:hypothetical protein
MGDWPRVQLACPSLFLASSILKFEVYCVGSIGVAGLGWIISPLGLPMLKWDAFIILVYSPTPYLATMLTVLSLVSKKQLLVDLVGDSKYPCVTVLKILTVCGKFKMRCLRVACNSIPLLHINYLSGNWRGSSRR